MAKKEEKAAGEGRSLQTRPAESFPLSSRDEFERLFDEFFGRNWVAPFFRHGFPSWPDMEPFFGGRTPRVDLIDRDRDIVVRAELPGVEKDGLEVSLSERSLTIRAATQQEKKEEKGHYYRREMSRGEFVRTLALPCEVEGDKAKASFKDGVLELSLPKVAASQRKTIKVE